jgi:hypothetical protein
MRFISESKVAQWAREAQRLRAKELREYVAPRRYVLVLSALRAARGRLLDDLTKMFLKFSGVHGFIDEPGAAFQRWQPKLGSGLKAKLAA